MTDIPEKYFLICTRVDSFHNRHDFISLNGDDRKNHYTPESGYAPEKRLIDVSIESDIKKLGKGRTISDFWYSLRLLPTPPSYSDSELAFCKKLQYEEVIEKYAIFFQDLTQAIEYAGTYAPKRLVINEKINDEKIHEMFFGYFNPYLEKRLYPYNLKLDGEVTEFAFGIVNATKLENAVCIKPIAICPRCDHSQVYDANLGFMITCQKCDSKFMKR